MATSPLPSGWKCDARTVTAAAGATEEPQMTTVTKTGRHWQQNALTLTDTHLHVGVQSSVRACVRAQLICDKRCSSWRCPLMTQPAAYLFPYHGRGSCRLNVHWDSHLQLPSCQPSLMIPSEGFRLLVKSKKPKYPVELEAIPGCTPPPSPPGPSWCPLLLLFFNFNIIKCFSHYKARKARRPSR